MRVEKGTVEGNGAYCQMCALEERDKYLGNLPQGWWKRAREKAALPRGTEVIRLSTPKGRGHTEVLCLKHARLLAHKMLELLDSGA